MSILVSVTISTVTTTPICNGGQIETRSASLGSRRSKRNAGKHIGPSLFLLVEAGFNLYEFVDNQPTLDYDALGLNRLGTPACKEAMKQAAYYAKLAKAPGATAQDKQNAADAAAYALEVCSDPPDPPKRPPLIPVMQPPNLWPYVPPVLIWVCVIAAAPVGA